jgi:hypothetical protein
MQHRVVTYYDRAMAAPRESMKDTTPTIYTTGSGTTIQGEFAFKGITVPNAK